MSMRGNDNFLTAHYDWMVAGFGIVAAIAAGTFFAMSFGEDPEAAKESECAEIRRLKPIDGESRVKPVDLSEYEAAMKTARKPPTIAEISVSAASFLASERRVKCVCGKVIPGDIKAFPKCPVCGVDQVPPELKNPDADGDGLPDDWELRYGLNPNDPDDAARDADGDGFTNLEEYQAKDDERVKRSTDPKDKNDHPDYVNYVQVQLPLKETSLPFTFRRADKIPSGYRLTFFDSTSESAVDRRMKGANVTAVVGDEIGKTGYIVKSYTPKSEKRERKGMSGKVEVDVSEATVERKRDKKVITLVIQTGSKVKPVPVDIQATLVYTRDGGKTFDVVPGSEIELSGEKYRISDIRAVGKGAKITLEKCASGKKHIIEALEQ